MNKIIRRNGFVFLALSVLLMQGCAEVGELRKLNNRQAITIRDQMLEIDKLKAVIASANKINRARIDPDNANAHYNLGLAYFSLNDRDSALEQYKILKTLDTEMANELLKVINE